MAPPTAATGGGIDAPGPCCGTIWWPATDSCTGTATGTGICKAGAEPGGGGCKICTEDCRWTDASGLLLLAPPPSACANADDDCGDGSAGEGCDEVGEADAGSMPDATAAWAASVAAAAAAADRDADAALAAISSGALLPWIMPPLLRAAVVLLGMDGTAKVVGVPAGPDVGVLVPNGDEAEAAAAATADVLGAERGGMPGRRAPADAAATAGADAGAADAKSVGGRLVAVAPTAAAAGVVVDGWR